MSGCTLTYHRYWFNADDVMKAETSSFIFFPQEVIDARWAQLKTERMVAK
jgi:hypothetical protein